MANIKRKKNNYFAFTSCWSLWQYIEENPRYGYTLENILTGAANATDGKLPLSKKLLFKLLNKLEVIDTNSVKAAHPVEDRQAQRICSALRIITNALEREEIPKEVAGQNSFYEAAPSNEITMQYADAY